MLTAPLAITFKLRWTVRQLVLLCIVLIGFSASVKAEDVFRLMLEEPINGEIHGGVGNLRGWAVASEGIEKVEIFIDGEYAFDAPYGGARGDVGGAFSEVPNADQSGFSSAYAYSLLSSGMHTIAALAHTRAGTTKESAATFEVVKFKQAFISDPDAVDLTGTSCSVRSDEISVGNAQVDGDTYDVLLDWRTAEQGFEIVKITERGEMTAVIDAASYVSAFTSEAVANWISSAMLKMAQPPNQFFAMIWPIGAPLDDEPDPDVFDGAPFSEHRHVLTDSEVDAVVLTYQNWLSTVSCDTPSDKDNIADLSARVETWIRRAADVATAPDPCFDARSAIYAWPSGTSETTARRVVMHEAYHGLSNYLGGRCAALTGKSEEYYDAIRWFAEGTAEYFGNYMAGEIEGRSDYVQTLLESAYGDFQGEMMNQPLESAGAYIQAAAIELMIQRGSLSLAKVLDGSYYHDCGYAERFALTTEEVQYIAENVASLQLIDGEYRFPSSVLQGQ
ncbi:hypothetical protein N8723_04320 [Luminiphilus sp.]|nr:hypothetical protein [Luminiphilus sp.]